MANLERKYTITLRKEFKKVPFYLRARKAVKAVRGFLAKNMKSEDVRIGKHLNLYLWSRGNRNPPHRIEVIATKFEEKGNVYITAELVGAPKEEATEPMKKKGGLAEKLKEKVIAKEPTGSKSEEKKEQMKELKKEEEKIMEHAEAPHQKTKSKKKEQTGFEKERAPIVRDRKETQHKKSKGE